MGTQTDMGEHPPRATEAVGAYVSARDQLLQEEQRYAIELSDRIRALRGKTPRQELADHIGVHVNTLGKFERGESMPDALVLHRLCAFAGVSADELINGAHDSAMEPAKSTTAVERGRYLFVPLFDVQASAGPGSFVDLERVVAMRPFDLSYVRGRLRIPHNEVALLDVVGASSEPVLRSGDTVMVDRRDREVHAEGLHLLRVDDVLLVKLVQRLPGRALRISSSNESYGSFEIKMDGEGGHSVDILGRVRWGGVTFQ